MKGQRLRIADYNHSPTTPYVLEGFRVNGKRKRLFFRTRAEAELALARLKLIQRREGDQASELGAEKRIEAVRCNERLVRFGKTITDATDFLIAHLEQEERARATLSVDKLVAERLATLQRVGFSVVHIQDARTHLNRFANEFGERPAGSITPKEIGSWLETLKIGPTSYNNFISRLSALYSFGIKQEFLSENPLLKVERKKVPSSKTQVITPADLQRLLDNAPAELVPALAISHFAGLRTAEIMRLSWDDIHLNDIDPKRRFINVPAHKAKSAQRRLVKIEDNLHEWLRPFAGVHGSVYNGSQRLYHVHGAKLYAELGIPRLSNCGRHSYASYWLAQHYESRELAAHLGHPNTKLVYSVYRELVNPEVAEAYWSIRPSNVPSNVVAIA
jgi:integrase